jgi:hypothetical protein
MENCVCPSAAAIPDLLDPTCPENLGQIVRFIFQRQGQFIAATTAAAKLLATYTPLTIAVDDTKIQFTPGLFEGLVIPPGEAITEGGDDNSTPLGRKLVVGAGTISVEAMLRNVQSAAIAAMRAFGCEDLSISFINEFGEIAYQTITAGVDVGKLQGFPVHAFFIGDKGAEGKNTQDKAKLTFGLDAGWRDNIVLVKPTDFDPRFVKFA